MSKQDISKNRPVVQGGGVVPKPPTPAAGKAGMQPPVKPANKSMGTPAQARAQTRAAQARPQPQLKRKTGIKLRPLDIGLLVVGVLVIAFIVVSALTVKSQTPTQAGDAPTTNWIAPGQPATNFALTDTEGKQYDLSAYKGKLVVLEFLATWCPHCQADAPIFNKLYQDYNAKGVQFFSINATSKGHDGTSPVSMDDLKWFKSQYAVPYPILFDPALKSQQDYGIVSYPSVYVLGKDGNVVTQPSRTDLPTYASIAATLDGLIK